MKNNVKLKLKVLATVFIVSFLSPSCAVSSKTVAEYSPRRIAETIISAQPDISPMFLLLPEDEYYADYLVNIYNLQPEAIEAGAICFATGVSADEIAVFLLADKESAADVKDALILYRERRKDAFTGYAPAQAAVIERGEVIAYKGYVALIICEEVEKAETVFMECFGDNPPTPGVRLEPLPAPAVEDPPDENVTSVESETEINEQNELPETSEEQITDDVYDSEEVLRAWRSGDIAGLSGKNKDVLKVCVEIINAVIREDMSDAEKELAVNDRIVDWVEYDIETLSNSPDAKPSPDNDNPYGALVHGKAVCLGYSSTFQLFMDLLGIECITVMGTYTATGEEHAWNMVRIDGEWYCTDVTWNAPIGGNRSDSEKHRFFNVSSSYMLETKHQWDENLTPAAY